jgi:hypothetical protein
MQKMSGTVLSKKSATFTPDTASLLATWNGYISAITSEGRISNPFPIMSFENTTDDIAIATTSLGKSYKDGNPIPKGVLYLDASICDYNNMHAFEGTTFKMTPFFEDGTHWHTVKSDGTLGGFTMRIGTKAGLPPEDKQQSYPLYVFFDNYAEFEKIMVIDPDFGFNEISELAPVGLTMQVNTAYAAGDVIVDVSTRCIGKPKTGLVAADFLVLDSNATPTVVVTTVVENGLGNYTLTIKKNNAATPANLAATDWVIIQAQEVSGTSATYLSQPLQFNGA